MKVYLAGASRELARVQQWRDRLCQISVEITRDWTRDVEASLAVGLRDEDHSHEARAEFAGRDLQGVADADLVWLLVPENHSTGAWVELGFALAVGKTIVVSGLGWRRSIFCARTSNQFDIDGDAFEWIVGRVTEERQKTHLENRDGKPLCGAAGPLAEDRRAATCGACFVANANEWAAKISKITYGGERDPR